MPTLFTARGRSARIRCRNASFVAAARRVDHRAVADERERADHVADVIVDPAANRRASDSVRCLTSSRSSDGLVRRVAANIDDERQAERQREHREPHADARAKAQPARTSQPAGDAQPAAGRGHNARRNEQRQRIGVRHRVSQGSGSDSLRSRGEQLAQRACQASGVSLLGASCWRAEAADLPSASLALTN